MTHTTPSTFGIAGRDTWQQHNPQMAPLAPKKGCVQVVQAKQKAPERNNTCTLSNSKNGLTITRKIDNVSTYGSTVNVDGGLPFSSSFVI
eukprot:2496885-Rhodomonas_salina.2